MTTPPGRALRAAAAVMGLYFVFATVVQWNDPDPIRWMSIYGVAAGLSFWVAAGRRRARVAAAGTALVALGWALSLAPRALRGTTPGEMFRTYRMMSPQMEEGREMLGLAVVAAWMSVLALPGSRGRRG